MSKLGKFQSISSLLSLTFQVNDINASINFQFKYQERSVDAAGTNIGLANLDNIEDF